MTEIINVNKLTTSSTTDTNNNTPITTPTNNNNQYIVDNYDDTTPLYPSVANSRKPSINSSILNGEMMDIFRSRACSTADRTRSRTNSYNPDLYPITATPPPGLSNPREINKVYSPNELDIVNESDINISLNNSNTQIAKHIYISTPSSEGKKPAFVSRSFSLALPKPTSLHMSIGNSLSPAIDFDKFKHFHKDDDKNENDVDLSNNNKPKELYKMKSHHRRHSIGDGTERIIISKEIDFTSITPRVTSFPLKKRVSVHITDTSRSNSSDIINDSDLPPPMPQSKKTSISPTHKHHHHHQPQQNQQQNHELLENQPYINTELLQCNSTIPVLPPPPPPPSQIQTSASNKTEFLHIQTSDELPISRPRSSTQIISPKSRKHKDSNELLKKTFSRNKLLTSPSNQDIKSHDIDLDTSPPSISKELSFSSSNVNLKKRSILYPTNSRRNTMMDENIIIPVTTKDSNTLDATTSSSSTSTPTHEKTEYSIRMLHPIKILDKTLINTLCSMISNTTSKEIRSRIQIEIGTGQGLPYLVQCLEKFDGYLEEDSMRTLSQLYGNDEIPSELGLERILLLFNSGIETIIYRCTQSLLYILYSDECTLDNVILTSNYIPLMINQINNVYYYYYIYY